MIDTIIKIRHYIDTNTLSKHENDDEIQEFKTKYEKLYKMTSDPKCDLNILKNFIILQEKIQNGDLEQDDADKAFGEVAAERYVNHLVQK